MTAPKIGKPTEKPPPTWPLLRRFWRLARPHRRHIVVVAVCQLLGAPLAIASPRLVMAIIDQAESAEAADLARLAAILVGMSLLSVVLGIFTGRALTVFHQRVVHALRTKLFRHVQSLSVGAHERRETGYLMARQSEDVNNLGGVMPDAFVRGVVESLKALVFLAMLMEVEWRLALGGLLLVLTVLGIQWVISRPLRKRNEEVRERWAEVSQSLHQSLTGHRLTVAAAAEGRETKRFVHVLNRSVRATIGRDLFNVLTGHLMFLITGVAPVLIILGGAFLIADGVFTVGGLFAFFMYLVQLAGSVAEVARLNPAFQSSLASLVRIDAVFSEPPEIADQGGASPKDGPLRLENVTYRYDASEEPALRNVTLSVPEGALVALVGPSGSGKSTLASLVLRFMDPTEGVVTLAGDDLRTLNPKALRERTGLVPQDVFLFDRSIRENIAFATPMATDEAIARAAEQARVTEFTEGLEKGLDTLIGERGARLSGGQRQRIAIARELLRNPRLLVLDEATSALDSRGERAVQAAIETVIEGRTALVIAHRLSTVLSADLIYVLDRGRIVGEGTHEELSARDGLYRELCEAQAFAAPEPLKEDQAAAEEPRVE